MNVGEEREADGVGSGGISLRDSNPP